MIHDRGAILSLPEAWPEALGYGPWLEEVWSNYLTNALKYGGTPPRIELGADVQPDGPVRFWMRDHGAGIPPGEQDGLFLPFGEFARARKAGHGLGLSIVRQIVEKLGGGVGLERGVVQGSIFYFTLPATEQPEPAKLVAAGSSGAGG
jgi:signal transduction histidine kinase